MRFENKPEIISEEHMEAVRLTYLPLSIATKKLTIPEFMSLIALELNAFAIMNGLSREDIFELISVMEGVWKEHGYPKTREEAN